MRVRKRKGAEEHLANHPQYVILEPEAAKGKWHELFGNDNPIHIEVGSGKGAFITGMAQQNPDINYIGIDIQLSVLSYALDKVLASGAENVKLLRVDGSALTNYFEDGEVDMMYLNFSDPWPKDRHARRRLPSKEFLARYDQILVPDGKVEFKTDNRGLFDFALEQREIAGWNLDGCTFDLHHDENMNEGNVMTEYEEKFSSMGNPIYKMIISR